MARVELLAIAARAVGSDPNQVGRRPSSKERPRRPPPRAFPGSWPSHSAVRPLGPPGGGRRRPRFGDDAALRSEDRRFLAIRTLGQVCWVPFGGPTTHVRSAIDASRSGNGWRVSGILHTTVSRLRRPSGRGGRDESKSKNPSRSKEDPMSGPGPIAASRDAAVGSRTATRPAEFDSALLPGRRGSDRRGQARKGAGGMPRRHQRFERGRLRKVRGSCLTSVDPGILDEDPGN